MKTTDTTKIEARIKTLRVTAPALVGADEGTHRDPRTYRIYETIAGARYGKTSFGGNNSTDCTEEDANEGSNGRIRKCPQATKDIRSQAAELRRLEKELRDARK